jgi:hypothetical protein
LFRIHESTPDSESLVLTDHKNNYFTKISGTKKIHGSNSRGTSRTQRPSRKIFFQSKNLLNLFGFFWKACIVTFQKSNICPNKLFETSELFEEIHFYSSNFQQISALEPNLTMKFNKLCPEILIIKSTTNNASKTLSCIKIHPLNLKISSIECQKTCEIGWKSDVNFSRFHTFFGLQLKISRVPVVRFWRKIAFWKRYELQIIWFKFRHKVCWTSLSNLAPKLKFAENLRS